MIQWVNMNSYQVEHDKLQRQDETRQEKISIPSEYFPNQSHMFQTMCSNTHLRN